ncbi:LOW QUALITY PROTEIN: hypothetical protein CRUP_012503 [Coryphaenoides rupestris]|nr:LOW QUALITY PROTEIN: hypothetical protein CRUP_012503 [Coryphaenoides rupestris]
MLSLDGSSRTLHPSAAAGSPHGAVVMTSCTHTPPPSRLHPHASTHSTSWPRPPPSPPALLLQKSGTSFCLSGQPLSRWARASARAVTPVRVSRVLRPPQLAPSRMSVSSRSPTMRQRPRSRPNFRAAQSTMNRSGLPTLWASRCAAVSTACTRHPLKCGSKPTRTAPTSGSRGTLAQSPCWPTSGSGPTPVWRIPTASSSCAMASVDLVPDPGLGLAMGLGLDVVLQAELNTSSSRTSKPRARILRRCARRVLLLLLVRKRTSRPDSCSLRTALEAPRTSSPPRHRTPSQSSSTESTPPSTSRNRRPRSSAHRAALITRRHAYLDDEQRPGRLPLAVPVQEELSRPERRVACSNMSPVSSATLPAMLHTLSRVTGVRGTVTPAWVTPASGAQQASGAGQLRIYPYDGRMFHPGVLCPTCRVVKPARSKHCRVCDRCVHRFDHHCVWLNNCVGAQNARYFLLYLLSVCSMAGSVALLTGDMLLHATLRSGLLSSSYLDRHGQRQPAGPLFVIQKPNTS